MPRPTATAAAAAARFIDIAMSPLGPRPRRCLVGLRYGQVTSISNVLVTGWGCCGLLLSTPAAVPLIAYDLPFTAAPALPPAFGAASEKPSVTPLTLPN